MAAMRLPCKSFCDRPVDGKRNCVSACIFWPPPPPPPPPPRRTHHDDHDLFSEKHLILIIILITASVITGFFLLYFLFKRLRDYYYHYYYSRRENPRPILFNSRRDFDDNDEEGHVQEHDHHVWYLNTVGLQQSVIDSITVFKFKKDDNFIDGTDCSVCLAEFQEQESLRLLPKCSHAFHVLCIDTWLRSHKNCPLCRAPVVLSSGAGEEDVSGDTQMEIQVEENRSEEGTGSSGGGERRGLEISVMKELSENHRQGLEPLRRSVSLDSVSAAAIYQATNIVIRPPDEASSSSSSSSGKVKNSVSRNFSKLGMGNQSLYNLVKSTSFRISMKRINSSGKKVFSRHSRSHSSVLPL